MSKRQTEKVLPITWDGFDEGDPGDIQFYNVEFTEDFGPFEKGEKVNCLLVSMQDGVIKNIDKEGNVQELVSVKFTPVFNS